MSSTKVILLACVGLESFDGQKYEFQTCTTQCQDSYVWLHLLVVATPLVMGFSQLIAAIDLNWLIDIYLVRYIGKMPLIARPFNRDY